MQGVRMLRSGIPASHVAHHFDVSVRAVFKWVEAFYDVGQNAVLAREGGGRLPKLTAKHLRRIAGTVRDRTPDQFKLGLCTLRPIENLLERQFQMTLSVPTLGKVMRQLGFTAQRPLHRASQQDARPVQRWRAEEYPALQARAKALRASIMFANEAAMRSGDHPGTTWAPRGGTPVVRATGRRVSVQMLSAVATGGQLQSRLHQGLANATGFRSFLEQLMLGATQCIFLSVDGHSIHKAKPVGEYIASTDGMIELHFLPPYPPQLNPDEQVWKSVKERIAKQKPLDCARAR